MTRCLPKKAVTRNLARFLSKNPRFEVFDHQRARLMFELNEECYGAVNGLRRDGRNVFVDFGGLELKFDLARARRELLTLAQLRLKTKLRGEVLDWLGDIAVLTKGKRIGCLEKQVGMIGTRKLPTPDVDTRYFADRVAERARRCRPEWEM